MPARDVKLSEAECDAYLEKIHVEKLLGAKTAKIFREKLLAVEGAKEEFELGPGEGFDRDEDVAAEIEKYRRRPAGEAAAAPGGQG